ncbi:hypothetical protein AWC38_SpisGene4932 [Stylophora pistillata]|uniref:Uncharacterized protein n=1 Tax=Stylophora pistillata TaxID=50429 RepID=A0A2B4SNV2_STYPI|nr:hypothetical protein AWC38_SpisGene4932 [Stylophora pistillata]
MTDLWNAKGYGHLSIKSQNLRDQASRLTKNASSSSISSPLDSNSDIWQSNILGNNDISIDATDENSSNPDANELSQDPNLHSSNVQFPEETQSAIEANDPTIENASNLIPDNLPHYEAFEKPSLFKWGLSNDGRALFVKTSTIDDAYNEISKWRKNTFLVPYGRPGKNFIDQLTKHINTWNNGAEGKHKEGDIDALLREGRIIQRRLTSSKQTVTSNKAKVFANVVMKGQLHSAMRYLSSDDGGGILPLSDDVIRQLREKHPDAQEAQLGSLLFGPIEEVPTTLFLEIDGEMVREAALRTKGSGGPCGVDVDGFRRILSYKAFKKSGKELCDALALLARRPCTEYVDPISIEALLSSRLIPLDKGEGAVRPIGVGEVLRRIIGKGVTRVIKTDVIEASGSLQVCAGLKSGSEGAIHAMRIIFEADDTDAVLLIDASNAVNALNRSASLHNIRV